MWELDYANKIDDVEIRPVTIGYYATRRDAITGLHRIVGADAPELDGQVIRLWRWGSSGKPDKKLVPTKCARWRVIGEWIRGVTHRVIKLDKISNKER